MHKDQLPIPTPCRADWNAMRGGDRQRHCDACDQRVHDLSAMTAREAERLVHTRPGICVRYACAPDGSILHRPARWPRAVALLGALVSAVPAWASPAVATEPAPSLVELVRQRIALVLGETVVSEGQVEVVMGDVAPPPPTPPPVLLGKPVVVPRLPPPPPVPPVPPPTPVREDR